MADDSVAALGFDIDLSGLRAAELQAEKTHAALARVADATQAANSKSASSAKPAVEANNQVAASATKAADATAAAAAVAKKAADDTVAADKKVEESARRRGQYTARTAEETAKHRAMLAKADAETAAAFDAHNRKREEAEKRAAANRARNTKAVADQSTDAMKAVEAKIDAIGEKGLKLAATGTFMAQAFSGLANMASQGLGMFGSAPGAMGGVAGRIGGAAGSLSGFAQEAAAGAAAASGMTAAAQGMAAGLFGVAAAGAAAAAALVAVTVGMASVEDRFTMTERRIRAANPAIVDTRKALDEIFKVAKDNGAAFAEVEQTFETMARAGSRLGATKEQVTGLVDALFKLSSMGGLEKNEGPRSVQLLGRMLESGKADGQMIRGILERNILLAREMAAGMGVSVQQLTMLMQSGEVTADKMLTALLKRIPDITREYAKFGDTMEDAWGRLQTSGLDTVRTLSDILGVSQAIVVVLNSASWLVESTRRGIQLMVEAPKNISKVFELRADRQAMQRVEDASRSDEAIDALARERATSTQGIFNERLYAAYLKDLQQARAEALRTFEADAMTVFAAQMSRSPGGASAGETESTRRDRIFANAAPLVQKYSQQRTNISVINDDLEKLRAAAALALEDLERAGVNATDAMVEYWRQTTSAADEALKRLRQTSDVLSEIKERAASLGAAQIVVGDAGSPLVGRTQGFIQQLSNSEQLRSRYGITSAGQIPERARALAQEAQDEDNPNLVRERVAAMVLQTQQQEKLNAAKRQGTLASQDAQFVIQMEAFALKTLGMSLDAALKKWPELKKAFDELRQSTAAGAAADISRGFEEQIAVYKAEIENLAKGAYMVRYAAMRARRDDSGMNQQVFDAQEARAAEQTLHNLNEEIALTEKLREVAGDAAAERKVQFEDEIRRAKDNVPGGDYENLIEAAMRKREALRNSLAVEKDIANLKQQIEFAAEEYRLAGLAGEEYAVQIALLEAKKKLLADGRTISQEQTDEYLRQTEILARQTFATQRRREEAAETQRIWTRALEGIQSTFVDTFERMFSGQIRSFSEFTESLKRVFFRMLAEMAAAAVIRPIISPIIQGGGALGIVPQSVVAQYTQPSVSGGGLSGITSSFSGFGGGFGGNLQTIGRLASIAGSVGGSSSGSQYGGILGSLGGLLSVGQQAMQQGWLGNIFGSGGGFNLGFSLPQGFNTPLASLFSSTPFGMSSQVPNLGGGGMGVGDTVASSGGFGGFGSFLTGGGAMGGITVGGALQGGIGMFQGIMSAANSRSTVGQIGGGLQAVGSMLSMIPGYGQIAGAVLSTIGSIIPMFAPKPQFSATGLHDYDPVTGKYRSRRGQSEGLSPIQDAGLGNNLLGLLGQFGGTVSPGMTPPSYYTWTGKAAQYGDGTRFDAGPGGGYFQDLVSSIMAGSPQGRAGVFFDHTIGMHAVRGSVDVANRNARRAIWNEDGSMDRALPFELTTEDSKGLMEQTVVLLAKLAVKDGSISGLSDTSKTIIRKFGEADSKKLGESLQFGRDVYDKLNREGEVTEAEKAFSELTNSFNAAIAKAKDLGLATDGLVRAQDRALNKYASDFRQNIEDAILGIKDPDALERVQIGREREKMMREAEYLNDQYAKGLISSMVDVAKVAELFEMRIKEATKAATETLETFYRRLSSGDLSAASPTNSLAGTSATYAATVAQALGGNADARRRFESDAEAYLRAQANYGGHDPRYAEVLARVRGDTANLIGLMGGSVPITSASGANMNLAGSSLIAMDQTAQIIALTKKVDELTSQLILLLDEQRRRNALAA